MFGVLGALFAGASAVAQKTTSSPPTDTSAQSSPVRPAPKAPVVDDATQSSPVSQPHTSGVWIAPHTALHIALEETIDSGKLKNGQTVHATLTTAVSAHSKTLPPGTSAVLTVVATVPAGKLDAVGEFSLQLESIGGVHVYTDTLTFRGHPGPRDVADAAPAIGKDAGLPHGAPLTFHVQPPPVEATSPPKNVAKPPGAVTGVSSGGSPPAGSSPSLQTETQQGNNGTDSTGNSKSQAPTVVTQPNTTSHPIPDGQPH
jgi:hypothetical protein